MNIFTQLIELLMQILKIFNKPVDQVIEEAPEPEIIQEVEIEEFSHDILMQMIAFDEGKVNKIYRDSLGYYTVGIGHLLTKKDSLKEATDILDKQVNRKTNGQITEDEIAMLFERDLIDVVEGVKKNALLNEVYNSIDPIRRLALFNMVFQLGIAGTANFKNSMNIAINNDWNKLESNLKQSLWFKQTTNRATRVIRVFCDGDLKTYSKYIKV